MHLEIHELYDKFIQSNGIATDSRKVESGNIFFALKGENFDGNRFAINAITKGASLAIVDDQELENQEHCFFVENALKTLQDLALYHRKQIPAKVIAITGSNGKTTTRELITRVLSKQFRTGSTQGNLNNHIGVPLTLLSLPEDTEFAIIEMGANHPGEIGDLCEIALPEYGLITNIGKAHLEGFGGFEGVVKAKSELYQFIRRTKGKVFINRTNRLLTNLAEGIEQIDYGRESGLFVSGEISKTFPYINLKVHSDQGEFSLKTKLAGAYNFENVLAALCTGFYFKIDKDQIKEAIETYVPDNNRSQVIQTERNTIILDAYNANPTSMKAAIDNFRNSHYKNKVLILGEMLELGQAAETEHKALVDMIIDEEYDNIFLVGENFIPFAGGELNYFDSAKELKSFLKNNKLSGKSILVKGSRKNKLEQIIEFL